ncbi:MAG: xanthine dehydrogenase family protein molybdopterin-binding subunit [Candidatus Caldarchaeum sp.]|nr:xanthine dehydrogenase family protein molybdopterin-binding subunit [Candidatus Caldarchaeum sp.]MDW7978918.1 xanthine dehydrogenase family protein molybdopterin-binding subunit [Candidatus Caldarchaeum sp.]
MTAEPKLLVKGWVPPKLDRPFTVVGRRINRRDAVEKVCGKALYANDIHFPGTLYAKILRSPHPHARIKKVDTSRAESVPGVKAVISRNNFKDWYTYWYKIPQPGFPEIVLYVGHEVAAVAAETPEAANEAVGLIEVEYERLPAVFDVEEALSECSPVVSYSDVVVPEGPFYATDKPPVRNVWGGGPAVLSRGDVEKGFEEADVVLERVYTTPFQHHGTLQTRTCVALWEGGRLTLYDSCQGIWQAKEDLALSFRLKPEQVRVIVKYMGGGFGSKSGAQRYAHYAAALSMLTGRPVRLELTRAEEFLSHPRRPAAKFYLKSGVKKNGRITAVWGRVLINAGSGGAYKPFKHDAILHPFYLYDCPNVHLEQWGVLTNLQFTGPTRSPLNIISSTAFESHVDELAAAIGMDPLKFRFMNYNPYADPVKKTRFSAKNLDKAMQAVCEEIGWDSPQRQHNGRYRTGRGMAVYMFHGVGFHPYEANAEVVVKPDGRAELRMGIVDIGTGSATTMAMVAAEELGVNLEDVDVMYGDTDGTMYAPGSHASRVIPEVGPAVLKAAAEAREQLFAALADKLKVAPSELRSERGFIYLKEDGRPLLSFREACRIANVEIVGRGSRAPNPGPYPRGGETSAVNFATFGATAAVVEVDTWTGKVRVVRCATAHEFGRVLNPKLVESQHYGGVLFGIGYALYEGAVHDKKTGIMLNADLLNYKIPTTLEMPEEIVCINIEAEDPYFAYSAKGGAEGINSAVPAAIRNAVYDAVGVWVNDFPIIPERLLRELEKMGSRDAV